MQRDMEELEVYSPLQDLSVRAGNYVLLVSAINHALNLFSAKHCILLFAIAFIFSYIWKNEDLRSKIGNFTYKYRYLLALTIFLMCVLFEIHGSSFGMWDEILGGKPHQTLLGVVRPIRSDEWNVLTPLALSQYFSNLLIFHRFQELV